MKGVVLPDMEDSFDGGESICVSYDRQGKSKTPPQFTDEKHILLDNNDNIYADFHEDLKTEATMYRGNKTGVFQVSL